VVVASLDRVQWQNLMLALLKHRVLLAQCQISISSYMKLKSEVSNFVKKGSLSYKKNISLSRAFILILHSLFV
jgi:hypothetical protein